jgi:hypothetical protein
MRITNRLLLLVCLAAHLFIAGSAFSQVVEGDVQKAALISHIGPQLQSAAATGAAGAVTMGIPYEAYHSIDIAVDADGGMHTAFYTWHHAEHKNVYYGYCPPTDLGACGSPEGWSFVPISDEMYFIEIEVTPAGKPRVLMYNDKTYPNESRDPKTLYRYAECDDDCTSAGSWRVAELGHTNKGGLFFTTDYNHQTFELDGNGNPRFVYEVGVRWLTETQWDYPKFYAGCEADCWQSANWWHYEIPQSLFLYHSSLKIGSDGRPRLIAGTVINGDDWLVYSECVGSCEQASDWTTPLPLLPIGSGPDTRYWTMQLDSQNRPRLAVQVIDSPIRYVWCDEGCDDISGWLTYALEFGRRDLYPVLALDPEGRPRMAFEHEFALGYAWCEEGCETIDEAEWYFAVVDDEDAIVQDVRIPTFTGCTDSEWFAGRRPNIALDGRGNPRLAHDAELAMRCYRDIERPELGREIVTVFWTSRVVYFDQPEGTPTSAYPVDSVPQAFKLAPNYPNPFNPQTTIPFTLERSARVRLTVHDALGRHVATLVDEQRPQGRHDQTWDAAGFSSGAYYVCLDVDGKSAVRQVVLVK